ncbi:DUF4260 family protein [Pedobacter sp. CG_S7]|uniref:DUF4260 family protein n=1 Tax=Pedobacter sp. CG_S7 TaxID=3143930 RepID=UPI0033974506
MALSKNDSYNLFHHRAVAILVSDFRILMAKNLFNAIGVLLFANASFDRLLGFGLKYNDQIMHTHLSWMIKNNKYH